MSDTDRFHTGPGPRSSLFDRLPPEDRHLLDEAIIERNPGSLRKIYSRYNLYSHGISFSAVARYARALRTHWDAREILRRAATSTSQAAQLLPDIAAQRAYEAAVRPNPNLKPESWADLKLLRETLNQP